MLASTSMVERWRLDWLGSEIKSSVLAMLSFCCQLELHKVMSKRQAKVQEFVEEDGSVVGR